MSLSDNAGYAGEVTPKGALDGLAADGRAQLVDVRTTAEWAYVGAPDLTAAGKQAIRLDWQVFPSMTVNADFVAILSRALDERGLAKDAPLYFLCRSGVRSKAAAAAMASAGYSRCFNVTGGFEGPTDRDGRRGRVIGWKAEGLPWTQP